MRKLLLTMKNIQDRNHSRQKSPLFCSTPSLEVKQFKVHKSVLAAKSPRIAAFLETDGDTNEVKIRGLSAKSVLAFLIFIFIGSVPDDVDAIDVFYLAKKHEVAELKSECEAIILRNVNEDNARETE